MKKIVIQLRCQKVTFFQTSVTRFVSHTNYKISSKLQVLERTANFLRCYSLFTLPASVRRILGCADTITAFWHTCILFINNKI